MRETRLAAIGLFVLLSIETRFSIAQSPSKRTEGVSRTFEDGDDEARDAAKKAFDALEKGLTSRARLSAVKAEKLKRTRETAYLMGSVVHKEARNSLSNGLDAIRIHAEKRELSGERDERLLDHAEKWLNESTESLEEAKAWKKELIRIDKDYKKQRDVLSLGIENTEKSIDEANDLLVTLRKMK